MKVDSIGECYPLQNALFEAFCNTVDLHYAIIGLGNQFSVFLRVAVLQRFFSIKNSQKQMLADFVVALSLR